MEELHLTKKDFKINWFSGTGSGGQHRNKHQNCCRIVHIATGIKAQSTSFKERQGNQKAAFKEVAKRIITYYFQKPKIMNISAEVIRNYNESKNIVHDKLSGLKLSYHQIVSGNNIMPMIEARREAKENNI